MDPFRNIPLRYRFDDLSQARAHVVSVENRVLFFFRHKELELVPGSPLQMEWTFHGSEPARLLHGVALSNVRKCGAWIELMDARPLRELSIIRHERKHRRMGTDLSADLVRGGTLSQGRLLDISAGGARVGGIGGLMRGEPVRLRLPSPDDPTFFHDLGEARVAWSDRAEMGLQFIPDVVSQSAVQQLVSVVAGAWAVALEGRHPNWCCAEHGSLEVPRPEAALLRAAV
jgi:hypothetical protein